MIKLVVLLSLVVSTSSFQVIVIIHHYCWVLKGFLVKLFRSHSNYTSRQFITLITILFRVFFMLNFLMNRSIDS